MQRYLLGSLAVAAALAVSTVSVQALTAFARVDPAGVIQVRSLQVSKVDHLGVGQYEVTINNQDAVRCAVFVSAVHTVGFWAITSKKTVLVVLRRNQDHVLEDDDFSVGLQCG